MDKNIINLDLQRSSEKNLTTTSVFIGIFLENDSTRKEFINLVK